MTYESAFGDNWHGLLADGSLDMKKIAQAYVKHYRYVMRDLHIGIADMISIRRGQRWRKGTSKRKGMGSLNMCVCRSFDSVRRRPICENYVLSASGRESSGLDEICGLNTSPITAELANAEPERFVMLTLSNCKDLEKCTKQVLQDLGFVPHSEKSYHNYRRFSDAAHKLIEYSIEYFEAPCVKLLEDLQRRGFRGGHESY